MIFVTVGTQVSFDRLVRSVDDWAARRNRRDVFAQIGPTSWRPSNVEFVQFMEPAEFRAKVTHANAVVAHAGMGSIITALELGKPILVMPRRGDLGEHRNDHQVATAKHFLAQGRISVAFDERELEAKLDELDRLIAGERLSTQASPRLIQALGNFIHEGTLAGNGRADGVIYLGAIGDRVTWETQKLKVLRELGGNLPVLEVESMAGGWGMRAVLDRLLRSISLAGRNNGEVASVLARRVRGACARMGMRRPAIWTSEEVNSALLALIPHVSIVRASGSAQPAAALKESALARHPAHQHIDSRADCTDRHIADPRPQLPLLAAR